MRNFLNIHLCGILTVACSVFTNLVFAGDDIVSRPVGYLRVDLSPNEQRMTSLPFDPLNDLILGGMTACPEQSRGATSSAVPGVARSEAAVSILLWDSASASYVEGQDPSWPSGSELEPGCPHPGVLTADCPLSTGTGFWLINHATTTQTVYLSGSLVLDEARTLTLPPSLSLIGYPYSTPIAFTNTALGKRFTSGSLSGDEISNPKSAIQNDGVLQPSHGYWYHRASTNTVTVEEPRPYGDPFPASNSLPTVTSVTCSTNGVTLAVQLPAGTALIDIMCKDLPGDGALALESGWRLAQQDMPVGDCVAMEWTDSDPPLPTGVVGRIYLIGRADIDEDGNGIPDTRDRFVNGHAPGRSMSGASRSAMSKTDGSGGGEIEGEEMMVISGSNIVAVTYVEPEKFGTVYVEEAIGSDDFAGTESAVVGDDGPKESINAGVATVAEGGVLHVGSGSYAGDVNLVGKGVDVRIAGDVELSVGTGGEAK